MIDSSVKIRKQYLLEEIHPVVKYDNIVHESIIYFVEIGKGIIQCDLIRLNPLFSR